MNRNEGESYDRAQTWISLVSLLTGLVLLYFGNQLLPDNSSWGIFSPQQPENRAIWIIIIGTAASVAGFLGLLRGKIM